MTDALRAGVIGLGVGEQHIEGYERAGCEVAVLCDFDAGRLAEVGERHPGPRLVADAAEVLDDPAIDVVSIASWEQYHHEQVVRALQAGKHVFVEKPVCLTRAEADDILAALRERPQLRLSSNLPLRGSPRFAELHERIRDGRMGRVFYVEADYDYGRLWKITDGWRTEMPYYSVVHGAGVHMVDLLLWLTGDRVTEVKAYGAKLATEGTRFRFDDMVVAILTLESGALAKVTANVASVTPHYHDLRVFGTEATFVNGLDHAVVYHGRDGDPRPERVDAPYPGMPKSVLIPGFVEAIRNGGPAPVTEEEVFATIEVCLAIEQATRSDGAVAVRAARLATDGARG
ncbi:MAG TPA: Gfo/Idh/MocA family oxidoreductase [Solirubrobacteraceae bacterium]|jgi:predicted dehydrogenase|nr:Gfo/Idh/MocA family oxidoreductase [Solirubrobacteraceae bacterium]